MLDENLPSSPWWLISQGNEEQRHGWSLCINTFYWGCSSPCLSSCSHTDYNKLFTSNIHSMLIQHVYFTSSAVCYALSICIPPHELLSFSLRRRVIALFAWISHFLFGVCIRSLVLMPSTHQTLKARKETERRAHRKYISEGIVAKFEVNGRGWLWKESGWRCQDNGKEKSWPLSEKANGKPKRSRKHKAVNYNIHRYASKKVRLMSKALFIL